MTTHRVYPQTAARAGVGRPTSRYRVDLLAELGEASLATMRRIGHVRVVRDGHVVQQRGDRADCAIVIQSGRLRVLAHTPDGDEQLVRWMERGEVSGLSSVLAGMPVPVDLVAEGRTELLVLPKAPLLRWLRSDAEATLTFARVLGQRVNELLESTLDRTHRGPSHPLRERVWSTLQAWARENGIADGKGWTSLRVSQADIASGVGASRQRVNIELKRLVRDGRLRLGYRRVEIADASA